MHRRCVLLACFFLPGFWLCGAAAEPQVVRHEDPVPMVRSWRHFDRSDGLINGTARAVCQARDGGIWVAGQEGVCRYDGKAWTVFRPKISGPDTSGAPMAANAVLEAGDGAIWVGSERGVTRFDGETWTTYTDMDGLPGPVVRAVCETSDGAIWVGCGTRSWLPHTPPGGLARWDGGRWQAFTQEDGLVQAHVNAICEDAEGTLWVGTDGGVSRYDGQRWMSYTASDGLPHGMVLSVHQAADGAMWFGTKSGIGRYADGRWTSYALAGRVQNVESIRQTRDGVLWAYSGSGLYRFRDGEWALRESPLPVDLKSEKMSLTEGDVFWLGGNLVVRFDYSGTKWASYRGLAGPPYQDPKGGLWFCRASGGTVFFDGATGVAFPDIEWPVYRTPQGTFWCGGEGGIRSYDGRTWWTHPGRLDSLLTINQGRDGRLWFVGIKGGHAAVACYDGSAWTAYAEDDWNDMVSLGRKVVEAPNGDFWFVPAIMGRLMGYGVVRFDGTRWHRYTTRDIPGAGPTDEKANRVYDLEIDGSGTVWVGTFKGLWSFDGVAWRRFLGGDAPVGRKVTRVYPARDGSLWCACGNTREISGGVFRYRAGAWTAYTEAADGLSDNNAWDIFESKDGTIWVATAKGVSRFDGRTWTRYTSEDGLLENNVGYIFQDASGAFWLGKGYYYGREWWWTTRYRPDRMPPETTLEFLPGDELPTGNLILEWSGKDAWKDTPVEDLVYSCQMDDGEWSGFSPDVKQVFLNLASGRHTFRVRARDRDFNVDPTPAIHCFYVIPPVWQRPWFIGLMILLLGAIALQTGRVIRRDRRLTESNQALFRSNEDLREEIAERKRIEAERARLDVQLQDLRYLYLLRVALGNARSPEEVVLRTGEALVDVLSAFTSAGVRIEHGDYVWSQGETDLTEQVHYEAPISWGGREQGRLHVFCGVVLSESQKRALLDETAGQMVQVLEARELEMELLQSSRLVSLGEMAAGVAHELNQPLGAISTTAGDIYMRLVEGITFSEDDLKIMMQDVVGLVERMGETVEHLRVFSRDTSEEEGAQFSVNEAVRSSLGLIETQLENHGIALSRNLVAGMPEVWGRQHQLEQVVLNLLSNARDAVDEKAEVGGMDAGWRKRIVVQTCLEEDGQPQVVLRVEDNGVGMDEASARRAFEPFYTTKGAEQGTGLGLSISYAIVKKHGGEIHCESRMGEGTTFRVVLPATVSA